MAELFEARKPKEQAVISEIDGEVSYGGFVKGQRKVLVDNKMGDVKEYFIPKGKHVNVHEGDWVRAGEPLMDGSANPHDILDVLGPNELQKYLVDEVQDVYRLQGVSINDKHIEIIVRQMLRKVRIEDPGDTEFLPGSQVSKMVFEEENDRVSQEGRQAGARKAGSPRHHEGGIDDRQLHFGGVVPGNDSRADRGGDQWTGRQSARVEGERDRRTPDSSRVAGLRSIGTRSSLVRKPEVGGGSRSRHGCSGCKRRPRRRPARRQGA